LLETIRGGGGGGDGGSSRPDDDDEEEEEDQLEEEEEADVEARLVAAGFVRSKGIGSCGGWRR